MKGHDLRLCLFLASAFLAPLAKAATVTDFPIHPDSPPTGQPQGIALGADGNLWVAEYSGNAIVVLNPGGVRIGSFTLPTPNAQPIGIAAGPDGALWFTEYGAGQIGRVTTAGMITEFPLSSAASQPYFICAGPDGAMWFTEFAADRLGRITTSGAITEFSVTGAPTGIASGPDGALWFTEYTGGAIGRLTTGGGLTEYPIPTTSSAPYDITKGPDGALWFTESATSKIGRVTSAGVFTEFPTPTPSSGPAGILDGVDGRIWFAERNASRIGAVSTAGEFAELPAPSSVPSQPAALSRGPAGTMWFTEGALDRAGRINLADPLVEFAIPPVAGSSLPLQATSIVRGPDDQIWFGTTDNRICRILDTGSITCFSVPNLVGSTVTSGSDGALWFGDYSGQMGRMTLGGVVTRYPLPSGWGYPTATALGPDGNVWYLRSSSFGRITPAASAQEWSMAVSTNSILAAGPDGNMWTGSYNSLVRLALTGTCTSIPTTWTSYVTGITSGPDGNLWCAAGGLGRVTPTGLTTFFPLDGMAYSTGGITTGSDGNLWLLANGQLYRADTSGTVLGKWPSGTSGGWAPAIVSGPSGTIWWTDNSLGAIGRLTITTAPTSMSFHTLSPCRLLDTRQPNGPFGGPNLTGSASRTFVAVASCGIPLTARALSVNLTTITSGLGISYPFDGDVIAYASDIPTPYLATSVSYRSGRDRANNALVKLSADGTGAFAVVNRGYVPINLVVDVNGWFE
jgi:streptogramin lyase